MRLPRNFNPLHREGGDLLTVHYLPLTAISIHSTARVETIKFYRMGGASLNFNPLHREGGDRVKYVTLFNNLNFNPLHREGGDSAETL